MLRVILLGKLEVALSLLEDSTSKKVPANEFGTYPPRHGGGLLQCAYRFHDMWLTRTRQLLDTRNLSCYGFDNLEQNTFGSS